MQAQRGNIPELDGIRGIACLVVLIAHCLVGPLISGLPAESTIRYAGGMGLPVLLGGVDLFFVLSGFLIGGILLDNRDASNFFRAFWTRRIARIFPVAYLLVATYALALAAQAHFHLPQLDLWLLKDPLPVWSYATFTQSIPIAMQGYGGPRLVGITWSLAIEEQFYLLFPFVVYFLSRRAVAVVAIGGIVAALVLRAEVEVNYGWYASYVLLPCRMDGLMFGVLGALIVRTPAVFAAMRRFRLLWDIGIIAVIYSFLANFYIAQAGRLSDSPLLFTIVNTSRYSAFAFMCLLFILRVFFYEPGIFHRLLRSTVLVKAGLISYALYMYHQAVNGLLHGFIFNQEPRIGSLAEFTVALLVIAIAIGLATLSYIYMENPIRRLGHRVRYMRESQQRAMVEVTALPTAIVESTVTAR